MDGILEFFARNIGESIYVGAVFSFLAGIISTAMPCFLATLPLIISYVAVSKKDSKSMLVAGGMFALGNSVTFILLGILAGTVGRIFSMFGKGYYILLAVIMLLVSLQILGVYEFIKPTYLANKAKKKGIYGAFVAGVLSGVFSSPCQTPVLAALLALASNTHSILSSAFLLAMYSAGSGLAIMFLVVFLEKCKAITRSEKYAAYSKIVTYILGGITLAISFILFYMGF